MEGNYYLTVLLAIINNFLLVTCFEGPHCFNYTWPASAIAGKGNCTEHNIRNPYTPCTTPVNTILKPNATYLWEIAKNNKTLSKYFCSLEADNVCIKYTYMYNGAIANVSHFCGKVVEDRTLPITSGCYTQHTEGFTVEVCVCQTKGNNMPCNIAIRNTSAILIIIVATAVSLFIYKIL